MLETVSEFAGWYVKVGALLGFTFGAISWAVPKAVGWSLLHVLVLVPCWPYVVYRTFKPKPDKT